MSKKPEVKPEEKEISLLDELCGGDTKLHDFLGEYLLEHPLAGISQKDLDILVTEAEKNGNYRTALDKAIFEGSQKPAEKEKYKKVIQDLAQKTIKAAEQEKARIEKEGLTSQAAYIAKRIENQKFLCDRTDDIMDVACQFYNEKLMEVAEDTKREERKRLKSQTESQEVRLVETEKARKEARKQEEKKMGKEEKREAEKQDKSEELAAGVRKEAREEKRKEVERQETVIGDQEKAEKEARKKERKGA